ncbi:hypothetical protein CL654_00180 [bacterium]|nr:hypothetical protein [bacterium]
MSKQAAKERAIKLRQNGYSYSFIADEVGVSKSTLSHWLRKIPYTPNKETVVKIGKARARSATVKNEIKRASIRKAQSEAKKEIGSLNKRDIFMLGLGLYIGEGTKSHGIVRIVNSNPDVIKLALRWFQEVCGLSKNNFSITLYLYPDSDIEACVNYWAKVTSLSKAQFNKTQIDKRTGKKVYKRGKLPYGTVHLTVRSEGNKKFGIYFSRKIEAWMNEVYTK